MAVTPEYRAYVEDQLGRVVPLRSRRMFGGVGLYAGGLFFALIDDDILYFKVDDASRHRYEEWGSSPFRPRSGTAMTGYYRVPDGVLDDMEDLRSWIQEAVEVARRASRPKRGR